METIGRYKIVGELGQGAMGVVYRAEDPAIGRVVAIKTIRLVDLADPSERAKLRDRLMREAQSAGILSHPGIVTIYDVAEQDGLAYISMEFVNGPTLERRMITDPPDGQLVLTFLTQIAAALDYAHKRGIVHRDIKPANIMIHDGSIAKIADFGVARIQSHQMTQAGSMVGTPNYMSPEQIQGQPVNGRSDQFSLAVITYELLTGEKPFMAESIAALAFKIVQEDPVPAHRLNQTLGWPVDTVLRRALAKNPEDRYPTCSDFLFAVENACRSSKGWKPIAPGSLQSLPTLAVGAATKRAASPPVISAGSAAPARPEVVPAAPPRLLRWARSLALMVLGAGLIVAGIVGGLQWLEREEAAPVAARDETTGRAADAPVVAKPSPMPAPVAQPPAETPAASAEPVKSEPENPDVAANVAKSQPAGGAVRLVTNPPGAEIVVDGNPAQTCQSPCGLILTPGRHTLAATRDGYRRTLKIFQMPEERDIFLNLDRTSGSLMVRSEPRGASIVVDGQTRSEKTPALLTLPTGRHSIEVIHENQRETHEVVIRESVITNLAINLL